MNVASLLRRAGLKRCPRCGRHKRRSQKFYNDRSRVDGKQVWCSKCMNQRNRAYYAANKERVLARQKAHRQSRDASKETSATTEAPEKAAKQAQKAAVVAGRSTPFGSAAPL